MKKVLSIAGSDSSGGAGIQADLKTFSAHGVYGMSVVTAITAQNSLGVRASQGIKPTMLKEQIDAIFQDMGADAVKIGMVFCKENIEVIAKELRKYKAKNIVLDPVMFSKNGHELLNEKARKTLIKELLPLACVITPNIPEAEILTGKTITCLIEGKKAAEDIYSLGAKSVLIKGGHLAGEPLDIFFAGNNFHEFTGKRINSRNTHGTGCTLSSAIASNLALGLSLQDAIFQAKEYITQAIKHSYPLGKGIGPVHHFFRFYDKNGTSII